MPFAIIMPCTSSGLVSERTKITSSPCCAAVAASSAVKNTCPTAAPGEAAKPLVRAGIFLANCGCNTWSRWSATTRMIASFLEIFHAVRPVPVGVVMSTAILSAAAPVRLPTRVCNIHSFPCSMVNSVSHISL